jgi:hypothetical protein
MGRSRGVTRLGVGVTITDAGFPHTGVSTVLSGSSSCRPAHSSPHIDRAWWLHGLRIMLSTRYAPYCCLVVRHNIAPPDLEVSSVGGCCRSGHAGSWSWTVSEHDPTGTQWAVTWRA